MVFAFVAAFLFSNVGVAQIQMQKASEVVQAPAAKDDDGEWIHWDDGAFFTSIGTDGEAQFDVASRWEPADLEGYDGAQITQISFVPVVPGATYTIKIWEGPDRVEVYDQLVENIEAEEWNFVELDTPYVIDASDEFMFGYFVDTPEGFPAGADGGPAVSGKGDVIRLGPDWGGLLETYDLDFNWNIQAWVEGGDDPPPGDTYMLTLNVDMTDAVAANDVEFDPAVHHVFVSGTFAGWSEPGSNPDFELHPVDKGNRSTFYENWDSFDDWTTNLDPWTTVDVHGGGTWTASDFDFDLAGQPFAYGIFNPEDTDPSLVGTHDAYDGTKFAFAVGQTAAPAEENKWLISPAMEVTADSELSFAAKSITVQYGMERFRVYVSTDGTDLDDFVQISTGEYLEVGDDWEIFSFGLGDFAGETIHFAVECVSNDAFMFFLDAFEVTNIAGDDPPPSDEMVYTITVEVEEGDHQYKYFLVEDDPTWDMGEWEGDPNRQITVNADMTVNDEWAIITSIVEAEVEDFNMNLFPNPATTNITVRADVMIHEVKVYDITGRMVMQLDVNGHEQTLDVSTMRGGFYIMQVHTEQGVEGRRFHVAR